MLHNMILQHDGLDVLWESGVNRRTLNPDDGDTDIVDADTTFYRPIEYNPDTFNPTYVSDLLTGADVEHASGKEKAAHAKLQILLANNLQIMYQEGTLRWPKTRSEIDNQYNRVPREHFQNAGDLPEV